MPAYNYTKLHHTRDSPYTLSDGVQGEKPDLKSCLDIVFSLNKQWDVARVQQSLDNYRVVGNSALDANNFGLTFSRFCDIFQVPLYDPALGRYISEPGYRALLGGQAIEFVEEYFRKKGAGKADVDDVDDLESKEEKVDSNNNPQSPPSSPSPSLRPPAPPIRSTVVNNTSNYAHSKRPSICQSATFSANSPKPFSKVGSTSKESPPHPKTNFYISALKIAAQLFALFAKSSPISGQLSLGLAPSRRCDVFEIFSLLCIVCRGSIYDKSSLLFSVFDLNNSNDLSEDELQLLIHSTNSALSKLRMSDYLTPDDISYHCDIAFTDSQGRTRKHFTQSDFTRWIKGSHHSKEDNLANSVLAPLSLLKRMQNIIEAINERCKSVENIFLQSGYNVRSDPVLSRKYDQKAKTNYPIKVGMSTSSNVTLLVEVDKTIKSLVKVFKENAKINERCVYRTSVVLVGNITSIFKIGTDVLNPESGYRVVFSGIEPESNSVYFKTETSPTRENEHTQVISVYTEMPEANPYEDMFAAIVNDSDLVLKLNDCPFEATEFLEECLAVLEDELEGLDFEEEEEEWTEEVLDSLDVKYAEKIRQIYRKQNNKNPSKTPILTFGEPSVWLGVDELKATRTWPKAAAFIKGILEIVRREYIDSLWGEESILAALGAPIEGDDQDHLVTLQNPDEDLPGLPSGVIDRGSTRVLCLAAPTPDQIIFDHELMSYDEDEKGRKKSRYDSFDGKISFDSRQWRKIRSALKQPTYGGSSSGSMSSGVQDQESEHSNVVLVTTFPLLYDAEVSDVEDSFIESGGGGLSTIVSGGSEEDNSSVQFSLESFLMESADNDDLEEQEQQEQQAREAQPEEQKQRKPHEQGEQPPKTLPGRRRNVRRLDEVPSSPNNSAAFSGLSNPVDAMSNFSGSNNDDESSLASSNRNDDESAVSAMSKAPRYPQINAIPIPVPNGFVLSAFGNESDAVGFGRDDPPWIGGEDINVSGKPLAAAKTSEDATSPPPQSKDVPSDSNPSSPDGKETSDAVESPEKMSIIVDGKEIGKVRESVVTGSALAELLLEEAEEKEKTENENANEGSALTSLLFAEADTPPASAPQAPSAAAPAVDSMVTIWPDKRPSLYLQLAKSQFKSGETENAIKSLEKGIQVSSSSNSDIVKSWPYKTLLSNLTNTLQRGSDELKFQIETPVDDVIDSFFPEEGSNSDDEEEEEEPSFFDLLTSKTQLSGGYKAFPLPSHIRARPKWKQLKVAGISYAFQTGLEDLYEDPSDVALIQRLGSLAFCLAKCLGVRTAKLYRFSSVLLQKAFDEQKFEQPDTDKRAMLHKLARAHFKSWEAQGIRAEKEHLKMSATAFDLIMTGSGDKAPLPIHYTHYAETLTALGKKTQAVQSLMQLIDKFPNDSTRPEAELRLATLLHRLFQFEEAGKHFNLAAKFLDTRADGKILSGLVSSGVAKLLAGMNTMSWSMAGVPKQASERADEARSLSAGGFSKIIMGSSSVSLTGIVGRKWDYTRGKSQEDQRQRYVKDARSMITLAQLLCMSGDNVMASHIFELASELNLDNIAGVQMLQSVYDEAIFTTLDKAATKVQDKLQKEQRQEEDRKDVMKKAILRKGVMLADDDLALLLAMISKFLREGMGSRSVTIICKDDGQANSGMVTDIVDTKKADMPSRSFGEDDAEEQIIKFQQVTIGKCGAFKLWDDAGAKVKKPKSVSGICGSDGRFKFKHRFEPNCQSFAQVKEVVGEESDDFMGPDGVRAVDPDRDVSIVPTSFTTSLVTGVKVSAPPKLTLGPIVGKTTSTSSIILLEVDNPGCETTLILNCVLSGHTVTLGPKFISGNKAFTFLATGLFPNSTYTIRIQGPTTNTPADGISGSLATMPTNPCALSFAVVNTNRITSKEPGANASEPASLVPNLWDVMLKDLSERKLSPTSPDFILHMGAQVDVRTAYDLSRLLLNRWRKANPATKKPSSEVLLEVKEVFRDAYRVSWGRVPNVCKVFANTPSIMITGISDVVGTLIRQSQLEFEPEIAALALQVAREYQVKLWDLDAEEGAEDEMDDIDVLTSTKKDNFVSPLGHFHRFGRVGILCIDALTSNLFATGRNIALPLITAGQMQWLTRVIGESEDEENAHRDAAFEHETELAAEEMKDRRMRYDDSDLKHFTTVDEKYTEKLLPKMHSLVVCCEQPIVWHRHEDAKKFVSDPRRVGNGSAKVIKNSFSYHIEDCGRLLSLLFAWKQKHPGRDVLILCSSAGTGVFNSEITDTTTNLKIRQWAVPGVTSAPSFPFDAQLTGTVGRRFTYEHTPTVPPPHNSGLYERMKTLRKEHRLEVATLELEHNLAMEKREERQKALARGETFDDENGGEGGDKSTWDDEEYGEGTESRPKTPEEKRKEREEEEERVRDVQREKELQIAAQALVGGGDMFQAMEMISSSRPNTAGTSSRPGTGARKFGSRPGTTGSRAKTPQEKKRDEMWGPGLTEEKIWAVIRENEEYKRRRDMGYLMVSTSADTEQPTFFQKFVTPLVPNVEATVGPVIGEVTSTSAKILLETNSAVKARCFVQKLHDTSFFDYEELGDLAAYQLEIEMCKLKIGMQNDYEDESDPIIIEDNAKQIERLEKKIKGLAEKLDRVKTEVRTLVCEPNQPVVFDFDYVLEPNTKYWVKFEPFSDLTGSFTTLPERASVLSLSLVHGSGHFDGLLHASTPQGYETWKTLLCDSEGGGGSKFNRVKLGAKAATSYYKFGQSYNPILGDNEILPVFSDDSNVDFALDSNGEVTPRMTHGWYGGASGVGQGGERGLAPGGNAMVILDKDMSEPRRSHDIMIQIGCCGVGELFGKLNGGKFFQCLKVALGLESNMIGAKRAGGGKPKVRPTLRNMTSEKKKKKAANDTGGDSSIKEGEEDGSDDGSGFGDLMQMREKTLKDDAFLGFSDDEDREEGGVVVTESALKLMDRDDGAMKKRVKGEDYVYQRPKLGEHVEGSGGTLGNTTKRDDSSCDVPVPDSAVWPPEVQGEGSVDAKGKFYSSEVGEDGMTAVQRLAEEECLDMLKNAYRAFLTLPLAENIYKNVAKISLFTPDDLHKGMEDGLKLTGLNYTKIGDQEFGDDLHPLAAKRLRALSIKAWHMYCGSLRIEPIRERSFGDEEELVEGAEVSLRETMKRKKQMEEDKKKPPHQARFLNLGNTSLIAVDVRSRRCVNEDGLWGPPKEGLFEMELLSAEQWRYLRKQFSSEQVKRSTALVVVMESLLVSEDIYNGVGVNSSDKKGVTFDDIEKKAEKDGVKLSKKAIEAERVRVMKEKRVEMPMSSFYSNSDVTVQWAFHEDEQIKMLDMLFEWLDGSGAVSSNWGVGGERSLVVVCGGGRSGVETIVTDASTNRSFKQICVGTIGDFCRPFDLERKGSVVGSNEKYKFEHFPVADGVTDDGIGGKHSAVKDRRRLVRGWSYGELEVLSEPYDSVIRSKIVCRYGGRGDSGRDSVVGRELRRHSDHIDERLEEALARTKENNSGNYIARKLVGPVLGKVDVVGGGKREMNTKTGGEPGGVEGNSVEARVLLELDAPALVTLVATNCLTGETSVSVKRCYGRIPCVFVLEGMTQGRRYMCEWFGFEKSDCEDSKFVIHTPLDDASDFVALVVSGDKPDAGLSRDEESIWGVIADRVEDPWHGTEVLLHAGGQSGSKKDEAFMECLNFVKRVEARKEKAALDWLARKRMELGGKTRKKLENEAEEKELFLSEKVEMEAAMKEAVGEEEDAAVDHEVRERFRVELRADWNQPSKARSMKCVSNVMMRGGGDICSNFSRHVGGCMDTVAGRRVARLAEEVNREYMRQLWDAEDQGEEAPHQGFFTSWRGGMVGCLFIDARECLGKDAEVSMGGELENPLKSMDHPLMSDEQWAHVRSVLAKPKLVNLMVVCEVPFVWEGKEEARQLAMNDNIEGDGNYIQDHWAYRSRQLTHVLQAIFDWRAEKKGRAVQLICGSGSGNDCGFTTRVTQKVAKQGKKKNGEEPTEEEKAAEKARKEEEEADPPLKDIMQITVPPITGKAGKFKAGKMAGLLGQFSYVHSPLRDDIRGYAVIEGTMETGDLGNPDDMIASIDARLVSLVNADMNYRTEEDIQYDTRTPEDFDGTLLPNGDIYKIEERVGHPKGLYNTVPKWWYTWSKGFPSAMFEDEVYFRARESEEHVEARNYVERDGLFNAVCERAFVEFHLDDAGRPNNLRTMNVGKTDVLLRQLQLAVSAVWDGGYDDTPFRSSISYLKDEFVFHWLMRKCAPQAGDGLKTLDGFVKFVKRMFIEAGVMRMAVLCQHHQQWLDRTRAEREGAARKAEIARMQAEKAAFMAWLKAEEAKLHKLKLDNQLDEYQLKTVEKKQKEREWAKKEEENNLRIAELDAELNAKVKANEEKVEEELKAKAEREAEEAKAEQEEMNRLAEEDEEEYNKRLDAMRLKQAENIEKEKEGVQVRRRRLCAERKVVRRNEKMLVELPTRRPKRKVVLG
ncbi:hypothetical protein TrST_g9248 [Triparma strigata]|uniref:Uncharacterized protein n=1 Tax=Triparma strigata TaxID=1606541 RepID=A0A9W7BLK3_9STRA|nr:hypothetical protein TrST_g9248 [Triparma strigata]